MGEISFFVPASAHGLISLPELSFEFEMAIKKRKRVADPWEAIDDTDRIAPINFIAHSVFQTCQVALNNRTISDTAVNYGMRAYLEALTTYTKESADTQLTSAGWYQDTPGSFDVHSTNLGETARRKLFVDSPWVQLSGKVISDVTNQEKNLITGVSIGVRFVLAKPEFYLRNYWHEAIDPTGASIEYKAFIRSPKLLVRRYIGAPDFMIAMEKQLQTKTAKYHIEKSLLRIHDVPKGTQSTVIYNVHLGQLPKVCVYVI